MEWVDTAPQSRRAVHHCPLFFINIVTFPLFGSRSYFTNKLCRSLCEACFNLIYSSTTKRETSCAERRASREAAAFVDLLARLLVFSLVHANKTHRMSLEFRASDCFWEVHWKCPTCWCFRRSPQIAMQILSRCLLMPLVSACSVIAIGNNRILDKYYLPSVTGHN